MDQIRAVESRVSGVERTVAQFSAQLHSVENAIGAIAKNVERLTTDFHASRRPDVKALTSVVAVLLALGGLAYQPILDKIGTTRSDIVEIKTELGEVVTRREFNDRIAERDHFRAQIDDLRDKLNQEKYGHARE